MGLRRAFRHDSIEELMDDGQTPYRHYWTKGSMTDPDGDVYDLREVYDMYRLGVQETDHVFDTYDLPMRRDEVQVVVAEDSRGYSYASASPLGATMSVGREEWSLDKRPTKCLVVLNIAFDGERKHTIRGSVRHEIAHIADWFENRRTTEGTENHLRWLRILDAPK